MIVAKLRRAGKGRIDVYSTDNKYVLTVNKEILLKNNIKIGLPLNEELINTMTKESDILNAKEKALSLLSRKNYTKKQMFDKMRKIYDEDFVNQAVKKMESLGFIDDSKFARLCAEQYFSIKKFSKNRTQYELIKKGIDKELAIRVIEEINPNEKEQILSLLNGKYAKRIKVEDDLRIVSIGIKRLGYDYNTIESAIKEYKENRN